jgi:superfamily I DNA/RNA helicase
MWSFEPGTTLYWWSDDDAQAKRYRERIVALHAPFRDAVVKPFLAQWSHYLYRLIVTLLAEARGNATEARTRHNTLNYNDLLLRAARLLRENASVRRALQQKYKWLFVDEFHDTDPVQAEIMFLLAADEKASLATGTWHLALGTGPRSPSAPAPFSSSGTRNSPSIASGALTSTSTTTSAATSKRTRAATSSL